MPVRVDFQRPFSLPDGANEVLLVRHGACDVPAPDGLIGGRSDPPLNARGHRQAVALAQRLVRERVAAVFTTPLRRTAETATPVIEHHNVDPVTLPQLGEIFLGEWEGHGIHERGRNADPEFLRVMREQRWDLIPGAEPADTFSGRVREGIRIVADAAGEDGAVAVAVTHAAVIAEVCRQITGSEPFAFLLSANGSVTRLARMPDWRWALMSFNETEHLS
jgi:2,3-bisphosphoglycerate-dependent phosphoglycerate mutase